MLGDNKAARTAFASRARWTHSRHYGSRSRCQLSYHIGKPAISSLWPRQHTHKQNNWMTRKRWHGLARHAQDQWAKNGGRDMAVQSNGAYSPTIDETAASSQG